jgi:hypothetical protein
VRKSGPGTAACASQSQSQAAESVAIVRDGFLVEDQVELSMAFNVEQTAAAFCGRVRFVSQRELDERQGGAIARKPPNEQICVVRK